MKRQKARDDLRYLGAQSVRCQEGTLSGFRVCTEDAQPLGQISGVLISPTSRQLRYFVLESPGIFTTRRFLLPADEEAIVERDRKTLRIGARKDEIRLEDFNDTSVPQFSDDDLLAAMFSHA